MIFETNSRKIQNKSLSYQFPFTTLPLLLFSFRFTTKSNTQAIQIGVKWCQSPDSIIVSSSSKQTEASARANSEIEPSKISENTSKRC
jgi:hypothetical protein